MAAVWPALMVFSLGVLLVGSSTHPATSLLVQHGLLGNDTGAHPKAETSATGEVGHEKPLAMHQKEDNKVVSKNSSMPIEEPPKKDVQFPTTTDGISTSGLTQNGNLTGPPNGDLSPVPFGKVPQETGKTKEVLHVKSPKHALPSPAPKSGQFGGKGLPVATQSFPPAAPVANKTLNVSLAEAWIASTTTEHWPWLEDQTSATSQTLKEGVDVSTTVPRRRSKSSPTTEWPWLRDQSTASSQTSMVDLLDVSTATLEDRMDTHQPRLKPKGNYGVSRPKVATTPEVVWSWLDEVSTPSSTWPAETPGQTLVTEKTTLRGRAKSSLGPATLRSPKTATITTSPSTASPRSNSRLLNQCLLAISLLGLVAAIFIVITAVLAALLWRQKRAYKRRGQRPTEMVCISSLLATEEADEARTRHPRVKRVKTLAEANGLEAEMDNLTLNSFLPEH